MRKPRLAVFLAGAALAAGTLLVSSARAAGTKSGGGETVIDDLTEGTAGSVKLLDGVNQRELDGSLSQLSAIIDSVLSPATTIEAGYFTYMTTTPANGTMAFQLVASSVIYTQWGDGAVPNPSGTGYIVQASTASDFSAIAGSTFTRGFSAGVTGLHQNTTYYLRIKSDYLEGYSSGFASFGATHTVTNLPAGCGDGYNVKQDGSWDYTSIQAAVNALTTSLSTTTCVVIRDTQTYSESVTVPPLTMNNFRLLIMSDPSFVSTQPYVTPPQGASVAFQLNTASVTLQNVGVVSTNAISYGINATADNVALSSVNVIDPLGKIAAAAIVLNNWSSVANSSVTVLSAIGLQTSGKGNAVSYSTLSVTGAGAYALELLGASTTTVTNVLIIVSNAAASGGLLLSGGASFNTISQSAITRTTGAGAAVDISGSSTNTITQCTIANAGGVAVQIDNGATYNTVSLSTVTGAGSSAALHVTGASSNTVTQSYVYSTWGALDLVGGAGVGGNVVSLSTVIVNGASSSNSALYINSASNTVTQCVIVDTGTGGFGLYLFQSALNNWISLSTMTTASSSFGDAALTANFASSNTVTQSVISAANTHAVALWSASAVRVQQSTITGGGGAAVLVSGSSNTVLAADLIGGQPGGGAVQVAAASYANTITMSTITAGGVALTIQQSSTTSVFGSYVAGSTAVFVSGSTATVIGGSVLVAQMGGGYGLELSGGSVGLALSSSTVLTPSAPLINGAGVYIDQYNSGAIALSTNTITTSDQFGVFIGTSAAGASVLVTSNTLALGAFPLANGAGLYLDGLMGGATVQLNKIYYRTPSGGASFLYSGVYANTSSGLSIVHNAINNPGAVSGGFAGANFAGVTNTSFKFNDVQSSGSLTTGTMIQLIASTVSIRDNIFVSSITVSGSSQTVVADAASGYSADYNDIFSSNSAVTLVWGPAVYQYPWKTSIGQDGHSISVNPLWPNTLPGAEDFHPRSTAGRCSNAPSCTTYVTDGNDSPTIDVADPAEPVGAEPAPNGFQTNLGSTGGTLEASKSPTGLCAVTKKVCRTGLCPFTSIQAAVADIPNPLPGSACVLIEEVGIFVEQVGIQNFQTAGSSLTIMADPSLPSPPSVRPGGSVQAGFVIRNSSVNVLGINVFGSAGASMNYGLLVSSPAVTISSVNVVDTVGAISQAGIALSSGDVVSYSSVTVQGAIGIRLDGPTDVVSYSTAIAAAAGVSAIKVNDSSSTFVGVLASNPLGDAITLNAANFTTILQSTATCASNNFALDLQQASSNTVVASYFFNTAGAAVLVNGSSWGNLISRSTAASAGGTSGAFLLTGSSNTITGGLIKTSAGPALQLQPASLNTISSDTISSADPNAAALLFFAIPGFVSSSNTVSNCVIANAVSTAVYFNGPASYNTISQSTITSNSTAAALDLSGANFNTITQSYISNPAGYAAYVVGGSSFDVISLSTMTSNAAGYNALYLNNAATITVSGSYLQDLVSTAVYMNGGSAYNTVTQSTAVAGGATYAVFLQGSKYGSIAGSSLLGGAWLDNSANFNAISQSTLTANSSANVALFLQTASSNTITQCYVANPGGSAVSLGGGAANWGNLISQSTMTAASSALYSNNASGATIAQSVLSGSYGAFMQGGSYNVLTQDALTGSTEGAYLNAGSQYSVTNCVLAGGSGIDLQSDGATAVSQSTATGSSGAGIWVRTSAGTTIVNSYVQGSTGAYVLGSTGTVIGASALAGVNGSGVLLTGGSGGLSLSSSVVFGSALWAGVYLDAANNGTIALSTNTLQAGAQYGVYAATQLANTAVWITSNTILPAVTSANNTYGLYLNGLTSGATIESNGVYYRSSGSMGSNTSYALYAQTAGGLLVDHNRFSNPNMISAGGFVAVELNAAPSTTFKFNDVNSSGTSLGFISARPAQLEIVASPGVVVKGNIFGNNLTASAGFAPSLLIDGAADIPVSDYNDFFEQNANAKVAQVGIPSGTSYTLATWQSGTSSDAHSLSADPSWANPSAAVEDFHPKTNAINGRYDPATGAFDIQDPVTSPTIDAADPGESVGAEPAPNGSRANQGSYGQTAQASKSPPPAGCGREFTVSPGVPGLYGTIQAAVNDVAATVWSSSSPCVVIRDSSNPYFEQVDVRGVVLLNNNRFAIEGGPTLSPPPVIKPGAQTAAFVIANASVTVTALNIQPSGAVSYGILASSANVVISTVNIDSGNNISVAGIQVSSWSTISLTSATVQAASGIAIVGAGAVVSQSTAASSTGAAIYFEGASGSTATAVYAVSGSSAVLFDAGASANVVSQSTVTGGGVSRGALAFGSASFNIVTMSSITGSGGPAALAASPASWNVISLSTLTASGSGAQAASIAGSSNTISQSYLQSANSVGALITGHNNVISLSTVASQGSGTTGLDIFAGYMNLVSGGVVTSLSGNGLSIDGTAFANTVTQSTGTTAGSAASALFIGGAPSNVVSQCYFAAPNGYGAQLSATQLNAISQSSFYSQTGSSGALYLVGAASNTVVGSSALNPSGHGAVLSNGSNWNVVSLSTMTGGTFGFGVFVLSSSSNTILDDYVQGSTAAKISGSTGTIVDANVLQGMSATGSGLWLTGSLGLAMSSNTVVTVGGGVGGAGIYVDAGNSGTIILSTNTVTGGAVNGVYVGAQQPNTAVWIASNTVVVPITSVGPSFGVQLNGLTSGATVQNNGILYRAPGSLGTNTGHPLFVTGSSGVRVDHNRISDPGMITDPNSRIAAVTIVNSPSTIFMFNDVNAAAAPGSTLVNGYLIILTASAGTQIFDNILASSFTVTGSSATISADASNFSSDYNDAFSSTTAGALVIGAASYAFPWAAATGYDAHSVAVNPRWKSAAPGAEDFHVPSQQGSCVNAACGSFGADGWTSGTIDAADPALGAGQEPAPNGGRANLGSYGLTTQASETPPAVGSPAVSAVYTTSITVTYAAVGSNGYQATASTASDFTGTLFSSITANGAASSLSPVALTANTTYFIKLAAIWGDLSVVSPAVSTAATLAMTPAPAAPTFDAVWIASLTVSWLANGNPVNVTTYTVAFSTTPGFLSSGSVLVTTTPAGGLPTATAGTGIAPNTTYYAFVAAVNWGGVATPYASIGSTSTLANSPLPIAAAFSGVSTSAVTVSWSANGDPLGLTTYTVVASTASNFNVGASSITLSTAPVFGPSATLSLAANTTYYFEALAVGNGGALTPFVTLGSTITLIETPASVVFDDVSTTSLVASAYAPTPAFSNLGGGLSGTNEAINGSYQGWHGEAWTSRASMPTARGELAVAVANGRIYAIGGYSPGYTGANEAYDPVGNSWTAGLSPLPTPRSVMGAAFVGGKVYVVGGSNNFQVSGLTTNEAYDPAAGTWSSKAPLNVAQFANAVLNIRGNLYAIGGFTTDNEVYDPVGDAWSARAPFSSAQGQMSSAALGQRAYLDGGSGNVTSNAVYDAAANSWSTLSPMPLGRSVSAAAELGGKIYVVGGGTATTFEYDPGVDSWTARAPILTSRWNLGVAEFGGRIYAIGGTTPGPVYVMTNEQYDPGVATKFTGLTPNTLYAFKAQARNAGGTQTPESPTVSTYTLAAVPTTAVSTFSNVSPAGFTVSWLPNNNPLGATLYVVQVSTAQNFNANASSVSFSTTPAASPTATFSSLTAFTTYYFRVQAVNGNNIPTAFAALGSTVTLPAVLVAPVASGILASSTSTLTAGWSLVTGATGYTLVASLSAANPPTALVGVSSLPVGVAATTATVAGLGPNATYFLFVQADGPGAATAWTAFAATSTLAALPLTAVSTFSSVGVTSFTATWNANGNPLGITTYTVVASTASNFNAFASSFTYSTSPASGPSFTFTGLAAYTTYFFEVQAVNNDGIPTGFAALGSTTTLPAQLLAPAPASVFGVSTGSLTAGWALVAGATGYTLVASPSPVNPPTALVGVSSFPVGVAATTATVTALGPNTTYFLFVQATGPGATSSFTAYPASSTLANPPIAAASTFTEVDVTSMTVAWLPNGNPVGVTTYTVALSTSPQWPNSYAATVSLPSTAPAGASPAATLSGLSPNTTYFLFAAAINNGGVKSAYTAFGSTATLASPPVAAAQTFLIVFQTSMTVSWGANGNPIGLTTYTVVFSTASNFNAFATSVTFSTTPSASPTFTALGLASQTTYYLGVQAVNYDGVPSAFVALGSTETQVSTSSPTITNLQAGDAVWRSTWNAAFYNVTFADASSFHLTKFQVKASTTAGGLGTDLVPFTDAVVGLSPLDAYSTPWQLPQAVFNALLEGPTNYISIRVYNGLGNSTTLQDAFYVKKDTTAPTLVNTQAGDAVVRTAPGTTYTVAAQDPASGVAVFQYSASLNKGSGDASLIGWTNIALPNGATFYNTPWPVNFAALMSGPTNYISVRSWDVAGSTSQIIDAFYVLKDTTGPTVSISSPISAAYVSAVPPTIVGVSSSAFGVQGTEISVQQSPPGGLYWNPAGSAFNSASPVWMAASGTTSWALAPGIPYANATGYQIVARSSTTLNVYSTTYATATFTLDQSTPTVGVVAPAPNSVITSLPQINGTAAEAAPNSGISSVEVRLRRNSDGLWWNWFTQAWSATPISTAPVGTTSWAVYPTPLLIANFVNGTSYFIAVRATDNAVPPNQGNFFLQGSTFTWQDTTPPAAISNLSAVSAPQSGRISLSWTATGNNGNSGLILLGQYAIFYATTVAAVPSTATAQVLFSTASINPGDLQWFTVPGLNAGATYYLEVALADNSGNWSAFSNQASTVATPAPANSIFGHVVNSSTQGITAVEIDCWTQAGAFVETAFTLADGSGTYALNGLLPGNYKLKATWSVNGITSSVSQDSIAMGSTGVDFSLEINYALASLTGTLGTLTSSAGGGGGGLALAAYHPASGGGSRIELFQAGRQVAQVPVQPTGRWLIPGLLPGKYSVRAYTGVGYTNFQDVELAEGEVKTVGFVFDPLPQEKVYAFPNPARQSTTLRFETALWPLDAQVLVFDIAGNLVREIPGSQIASTAPGVYHAQWDLSNGNGQAVASGVYLFMVKVKGGSDNQVAKAVKKVAVIR